MADAPEEMAEKFRADRGARFNVEMWGKPIGMEEQYKASYFPSTAPLIDGANAHQIWMDELTEFEKNHPGATTKQGPPGATGFTGPAGRDFEWNTENQERVNDMVDVRLAQYAKPTQKGKKLPGPLANLDPVKVAEAVKNKKVSDVAAMDLTMHDLVLRLQVLELQVDELRRDNDNYKKVIADHDDRINWLET